MPERTCIGCRACRAQDRLLRFRRRDDGHVVPATVSRVARDGRSAYLCPRPECLSQARKRRAFTRAFAKSGAVVLDPKRDEPWAALWSAAGDELRREIDLLGRSAANPHEHPRRRGFEELLFELSSQPASPTSPQVTPETMSSASPASGQASLSGKGGTDHG